MIGGFGEGNALARNRREFRLSGSESKVMSGIRKMNRGDRQAGVDQILRQYGCAIDSIILETLTAKLAAFGIDEEDRKELRADLHYLRRARKNIEQAQTYLVRAIITFIVTAVVGAMWFGIKVLIGK